MKKSEQYYYAMVAVLRSEFTDDERLDIIAMLADARETALFTEKREETENESV